MKISKSRQRPPEKSELPPSGRPSSEPEASFFENQTLTASLRYSAEALHEDYKSDKWHQPETKTHPRKTLSKLGQIETAAG